MASGMDVRRDLSGVLEVLGGVRFGESKSLLLPACPNHMSRDSDGLLSRMRDSDGLRSKDIFTEVPYAQANPGAYGGTTALPTIHE